MRSYLFIAQCGMVFEINRNDMLRQGDITSTNTLFNAMCIFRELGCSMDSLKFCCSWKGALQGAKFNVKIGGLQLEGCSFDGSRLSENQRDSPSISGIPSCIVAWIKVNICSHFTVCPPSLLYQKK